MFIDNALVSPWVQIVRSIWQISISSLMSLISLSVSLKSNTCPVVLHSLSLVRRFVDDLFVPDFSDFEYSMYLNQDSFGSGIYPKTSCDSCELNCTSKGFSCNFLDLTVSRRSIL